MDKSAKIGVGLKGALDAVTREETLSAQTHFQAVAPKERSDCSGQVDIDATFALFKSPFLRLSIICVEKGLFFFSNDAKLMEK